jgi:hypothetical protein
LLGKEKTILCRPGHRRAFGLGGGSGACRAEAPFRGRVACPLPSSGRERAAGGGGGGAGRLRAVRAAAVRAARVAGPGGVRWRRTERAGARELFFEVARPLASDGGALAAPAPQALLSRFLEREEGGARGGRLAVAGHRP